MDFRAEDYFRAAGERISEAREVYAHGRYALAMYCSGLAVECLLRAFRWLHDRSFHGRHDLRELLRASRLLSINEAAMLADGDTQEQIIAAERRLSIAMNEVIILWHNNMRFASESRLKSYLNRLGRLRRLKGDGVKKIARDLLTAATDVVNHGEALWMYATK